MNEFTVTPAVHKDARWDAWWMMHYECMKCMKSDTQRVFFIIIYVTMWLCIKLFKLRRLSIFSSLCLQKSHNINQNITVLIEQN